MEMVTAIIAAIGSSIGGTAGAAMIMYAGTIAYAVVAIVSITAMRMQQIRAEQKARGAFNRSQRDRYVMVRGALEPRQLVLGQRRVSGPMVYVGSHGEKLEHLVYVVPLAGHLVDSIGKVYFGDEVVSLDEDGAVIGLTRTEVFTLVGATGTFDLQGPTRPETVHATAYYGEEASELAILDIDGSEVTVTGGYSGQTARLEIRYSPYPSPFVPDDWVSTREVFNCTNATSQTVTLNHVPRPASVNVTKDYSESDENEPHELDFELDGDQVTFHGGTVGREVQIVYQWTRSVSLARVRKYLGTSSQAADPGMMAALPGIWTSDHRGRGIAYLVVELDYDPDTFPGGLENVSAEVRGLKCYDPRTEETEWSQNPAVLAYNYAKHALGGRLPAAQLHEASFIAAANVCDTMTTYTVGDVDYERRLYVAGYAARTDQRPVDVLSDLCEAMGGRWLYQEGQLVVLAGAYRPSSNPMDESWLQGDKPLHVQPHVARADLVNSINGSYYDASNKYRAAPFAPVEPEAYKEEDGAKLPLMMDFEAVPFGPQAQYIAACKLREARQGMTIVAMCNMRAWRTQVGDAVPINLARFGLVNKEFECWETEWTLDGGIKLVLRETHPSIWDMDAGFPAEDPAPNTRLPDPWILPRIEGVEVISSGVVQSDGSIQTVTTVSWDTVNDPRIRKGGKIEVQFALATTNGSGNWPHQIEQGDAPRSRIYGLTARRPYKFVVRGLGNVGTGPWSAIVYHTISASTTVPDDVSSLTATPTGRQVRFKWAASTSPEYMETELRRTSWSSPSEKLIVSGTAAPWTAPSAGEYTWYARHRTRSGIYSDSSTSVTVLAGGTLKVLPPSHGSAADHPFEFDEVRITYERDGGITGAPSPRPGTGGWVADGWFEGGPSDVGDDYYLMVRLVSGDVPAAGADLDEWLRLNTNRTFQYTHDDDGFGGAYGDFIAEIATDDEGEHVVSTHRFTMRLPGAL